ncbi:MAG: hypothetical protein EPO26_01570 [Chloroflexota bacterium]|nr:MAG: hypothetical protein EPO26_01570 [Chloroflexota bacterium]
MTDLGGSHSWLRDAAGGVERAHGGALAARSRPSDDDLATVRGFPVAERQSIGPRIERVRFGVAPPATAILKSGGFWRGARESILYESGLLDFAIDGAPRFLGSGAGAWILIEDCDATRRPDLASQQDVRAVFQRLASIHAHHRNLYERIDEITRESLASAPLTMASPCDAIDRADDLTEMVVAASRSRQTWEIGAREVAALDSIREWARGPFGVTLADAETTLLHGDYQVGNWLIDAAEEVRVIDWELAAVGPGILDLQFVDVDGRWSVFAPSGDDALIALDAYCQRCSDLHAAVPRDPVAAARDAVTWGAIAGARARLADFRSGEGKTRGNRAEIPGQVVDLIAISERGARRRLGL